MAELVECPRCGGTGVVKRPDSEVPETEGKSNIKGNVTKFMHGIGLSGEEDRIRMTKEEESKREFITCPQCKGFGYVRG